MSGRSSTDARTTRQRWWRATAIVGGALLLIAAVAILWADARGKSGVTRELALWRASGDPLLATQLETERVGLPPEWRRWLDDWDSEKCEVCGAVLFDEEVAALRECFGEFDLESCDSSDLTAACDAALRDPALWAVLTPCQRAVLAGNCVVSPACEARLSGVRDLPRFPGEGQLAGGATTSDVMDDRPFFPMLHASDCALGRLRRRRLTGESLGAMDDVHTLFELARAGSGTPLTVGFYDWLMLVRRGTLGLELTLPTLAPDVSVDWLESELSSYDVHAQLERAWNTARLAGHNTYVELEGRERDWEVLRDPAAWYLARCVGLDHGLFLESLRRGLAHVNSPAWRMAPSTPLFVDLRWPMAAESKLSYFMVPDFERDLQLAIELEARIELARAAIVNHRDGTAAARAWLAGRTDPFSGKPLRSRVDPDGVLVMWSVGADRVDGGAPRRPPGCVDWPEHDLDWLARER